MLLVTVINPATGGTGQISFPEPVVVPPPASTSAVYQDVETIFPDATIPSGSRVGYVLIQPPNWVGSVTLPDPRFIATTFSGSTQAVTTTVDLPVNTFYVGPMSTKP